MQGFSVPERIVLHLSNYSGFRDQYLNPETVTQEGIASAVGIARSHVPRAMGPLMRDRLVEEAKGRVKGCGRRRKVYYLNERGMADARALRERQDAEALPSSGLPEIRKLVGRDSEVREGGRALAQGKVLWISGEDGIGKTSLAAVLARQAARERQVMWYTVPPGSGLPGLLKRIAEFALASGNRLPGYRLSSPSSGTNVLDVLREALAGCLVVLDDLQNADAETIGFLLTLLDTRDVGGIGFILVRNGGDGAALGPVKRMHEMRLGSLDQASVMDELRDIGLEDQVKACEFAMAHPLFLGAISRGSGRPSSMKDFLEETYGRLTAEERHAMDALSLFKAPVGQDILSGMGVDYQVLVNLIGMGLVREVPGPAFDSHSILKDHFYSLIPARDRRRLHAAAAERLAKGRDDAAILESMAHMLKAGSHRDCAAAVARNGPALLRKGLASELGALMEAVDWDALEGEETAELLLVRGYMAKLKGDWDAALADYQRALGIFQGLGNACKQADALAKIGRVHLERGDFEAARKLFGEGLDLIGMKPHVVKARILDELATIHLRKRETDDARQKLDEAVSNADGDPEMTARLHNSFGNLFMTLGSLQEARQHYETSLEGLKDIDGQMSIVLLNNLAIISFKTGDVDGAVELWERAAAKAEAMHSLNVMLTFANLGSIHFSIGNWDRAAELCAKALEISESVGKDIVTASARSTLGHIDLYRGGETWTSHYTAALELRGRLGDVAGQASSHNDLARGSARVGDWIAAEEHAREALRLATVKGDGEQAARAHLCLAEAAAGMGDATGAKQALKLAVKMARDRKDMEMLALAYRAVGNVSWAEGEEFVAERYLRDSVELLEGERRPLLLGLAMMDHARILEGSGLGEHDAALEKGKRILEGLGVRIPAR